MNILFNIHSKQNDFQLYLVRVSAAAAVSRGNRFCVTVSYLTSGRCTVGWRTIVFPEFWMDKQDRRVANAQRKYSPELVESVYTHAYVFRFNQLPIRGPLVFSTICIYEEALKIHSKNNICWGSIGHCALLHNVLFYLRKMWNAFDNDVHLRIYFVIICICPIILYSLLTAHCFINLQTELSRERLSKSLIYHIVLKNCAFKN